MRGETPLFKCISDIINGSHNDATNDQIMVTCAASTLKAKNHRPSVGSPLLLEIQLTIWYTSAKAAKGGQGKGGSKCKQRREKRTKAG
ncbi:hypothetical protein DMENIID0001_084260 [Sergentomyia squamirostris]